MSTSEDKLNKLQDLLKLVNESVTKQEFVDSFKAVYDFVKKIEAKNNAEMEDLQVKFFDLSTLVKEESTNEVENLKAQVNGLVNTHLVSIMKDFEKKTAQIDIKLAELKDGENGKDGESVEIEEVIAEVLKRIPEPPIDTAESIANKLETLKDEDRLDASAIKNLPEFVENVSQGSGLRNIFHDTSLTGTGTAADPLAVVGGAGAVDGMGTTNEIAYWTDVDTLGALAVATYPSLTELSYVKGVTSAIQTQINGKGNVTKVGTPVDNQIGVWTGDGTIEGDTNFTWDGTTHTILGTSLLSKTGTATVGTQTYDSNEYKLQGSQWFTSGSVAKTLTGGMTIKPRNPGAIVTSTLDFGYAIDSSTERPVISYKVGDHYNDGYAGQLTLRSGYWDGSGSFATGYGSAFGGMIETAYDGTFAFRPVGGSGTDFSGMRAFSFGTHLTYASFWSRWGYGGGSNYGVDIRTSFDGIVTIGAGLPDWHASAPAGASGSESLSVTIDQVITGNNASRPALRITKATEQLRLGYDASNYFSTTVASTGSTTFNLVGTSPEFTFSDPVNVPDEAYGAGWNGNTEVPTKNAVYDKIETLGGGSGITRTVVTTSGSITLGATASVDYTYYVAGAHTLSMPSPNTNRYTIKNLHSAAITVDTVGAENIEGAASLSLQPNDSIDVLSDGTNWYVH